MSGKHRIPGFDGLSLIQRALNPSGAPVIGLYLTTASIMLIKSLSARKEFKIITPHLIGTPAILESRPGISQIELAKYLGTTRAAAGKQVATCLGRVWVRRERSAHDRIPRTRC
jgi:DNA-binding MarR family transcriptional regulator